MRVTEKEAENKWCPMSRVGDEDYGAFNRFDQDDMGIPLGAGCLGKKCMMFKFKGTLNGMGEYVCGLAE